MKAIETTYAGYKFRSRTEARWAVFFDDLGWSWEYEPEGFELRSGRYLPDFRVECGLKPLWVEVKGARHLITDSDIDRLWDLDWVGRMSEGRRAVFVIGTPEIHKVLNSVVGLPPNECYFEAYAGLCLGAEPKYRCGEHPIALVGASPNVERAVDAARSARFEFGQSGASR